MGDFKFLDSERKKLWERIVILEGEIDKKTSDFEKDAKQSSRKASEYRNKSHDAKENAVANANIVHEKAEEAKQCLTYIKTVKTKSDDLYKKISDFSQELDEKAETIQNNIDALEENFSNNDSLIEKLETLNEHFQQGNEVNVKVETLYKNIQTKKREIDTIYLQIFGTTETETNENGVEVETKIEGLKDQLEDTYNELEEKLNEFEEKLEATRKSTLSNYDLFVKEKNDNYKAKVLDWDKEYDAVLQKINKLLPNALTTGLSYAYSEKKETEVTESKKFAKNFRYAALGLAAVSLIPFLLSVFFIFEKKTLIEVLEYSPRFVLAIIPLYIPVLWIAYSANKKLNLSKRLIEEYTHKEVLSKTFEGLSHQIDTIDDEDISSDLRIRLLYNILSVSSENPGKLISDYNKSDHPLMDALEKSANLSDAVEKLENIPGLSKLARILENKSKRIMKEQAEKVNATLGEVTMELVDNDEEERA